MKQALYSIQIQILIVIIIAALFQSCAPKISSPHELASNSDTLGTLQPGKNPSNGNPPVVSPVNPVNPVTKPVYAKQLADLAGTSQCAKVIWTSRGRSPAGYTKGMVLSFARSLCRIHSTHAKPAAKILAAPSSGNTKKDVLAHYQDAVLPLGLRTNESGAEPLLATYSIGLGLGMKESSGKYCEGWDVAAGADRTSAEAEAGLFQASYDSMGASPELKALYAEYKTNPNRCLLNTYKEGVNCKASSILGSGSGADFQSFVKQCPAFAAEYTMTLVRIVRSHFGPLNRKTAEVNVSCVNLLTEAKHVVEKNLSAACAELL